MGILHCIALYLPHQGKGQYLLFNIATNIFWPLWKCQWTFNFRAWKTNPSNKIISDKKIIYPTHFYSFHSLYFQPLETYHFLSKDCEQSLNWQCFHSARKVQFVLLVPSCQFESIELSSSIKKRNSVQWKWRRDKEFPFSLAEKYKIMSVKQGLS